MNSKSVPSAAVSKAWRDFTDGSEGTAPARSRGPQQAEQGFQLHRVRGLVHPVQARHGPPSAKKPGHGLVGSNHELLDDLVAEMAHSGADIHGLAAQVELDIRLRQIEIKTSPLLAALGDQPRQPLGPLQHGQNRSDPLPLCLIPQKKSPVHLIVGQPRRAPNHRRIKFRPLHHAPTVQLHLRRHGQPGDVGIQAAQAVG